MEHDARRGQSLIAYIVEKTNPALLQDSVRHNISMKVPTAQVLDGVVTPNRNSEIRG